MASALVNTTQQVGGSLGTALLNTIAATATATYLASHVTSAAQASLVHGYRRRVHISAAVLAFGGVSSQILVRAGVQDLRAPDPAAVTGAARAGEALALEMRGPGPWREAPAPCGRTPHGAIAPGPP